MTQSVQSPRFSQGHALLIGVGTYPKLGANWQAPITAVDAQELAKVLQDPSTAGYDPAHITLLHDETATKAEVLKALDALAQNTMPEDTVLLFYSGHGHYDANGSYYVTTSDTEAETVTEDGRLVQKVKQGFGIKQTELLEKVQALKAQKVLLIFNACHSGELMPTLDPGEEPVLGENPAPELQGALLGTGEGRVIITACRPKQYSFIGPDTHTIFAQMLMDGLRGNGVRARGGLISAYDLYIHLYDAVGIAVKRKVPEAVRNRYGGKQEPVLTVIHQVGGFPVAMYKGGATLGNFDFSKEPLPSEAAVEQVPAERARELYQQIFTGQNTTMATASAGRDIIDRDRIGDEIGGNATKDIVHGDKTGGDKISVGNISGSSGIAIGRGASANVTQGIGGAELAHVFAQIYQRINARQETPDASNDEVRAEVQKIEAEANKGEQASENRLARAFGNLSSMAEDIFDVTVAAMTSPLAAISTVVKKSALKAKADKAAGQ